MLREELRGEMEGLRPFLGDDFNGWGLLDLRAAWNLTALVPVSGELRRQGLVQQRQVAAGQLATYASPVSG